MQTIYRIFFTVVGCILIFGRSAEIHVQLLEKLQINNTKLTLKILYGKPIKVMLEI